MKTFQCIVYDTLYCMSYIVCRTMNVLLCMEIVWRELYKQYVEMYTILLYKITIIIWPYVVCASYVICRTLYIVHFTMYSVQCMMHIVHHTVHCTLYKVQRTLSIVQYIHILHYIYVIDCMSYVFALNVCRVFIDVRRCKI